MWCPSATLSVWANAWLAGKAAPDDLLDALSLWAPSQSVVAYDAVAAGNVGLPWPDRPDTAAVSLLRTLRAAAPGGIHPVLPVPGDVRGLPAGTGFAHDALDAGEAVIAVHPGGRGAVGLVPRFVPDADPAADAVCWTVHALPAVPAVEHQDLGEAEYALRSAVRQAAGTLRTIGVSGAGGRDPRLLVEQLLESSRCHRIPLHAPPRAVRVLESAAHVAAIIAVSSGVPAAAGPSAADAQRAADALRPLAAVVRAARLAAVDAILRAAAAG